MHPKRWSGNLKGRGHFGNSVLDNNNNNNNNKVYHKEIGWKDANYIHLTLDGS
jgi:hypothetical protein